MKKTVAICKKTKKVFNDYKNCSGVLTEHIIYLFPGTKIPSSFLRRQYKKQNNKYWHEQFFDIITIEESEISLMKCKYCDWTTKDLKNKSGCYTSHLLEKHSINKEEYVKIFPEDSYLFDFFLKEEKRKKEMLSNENNYVVCKICNKKLKSLTNTHLKTHGLDLSDYKIKFPNEKYHSNCFREKTRKNLKFAFIKIKKTYVSKPEKSLREFLLSLDLEFDNNNRKLLHGIEIDLINHENKIGIEFNGVLYHSENYGGKLRGFHLKKTQMMNNIGYKLIHIFEDEWELKNEIVKNKLKYIFKKSEASIISARKCIIKEISSKEKNDFLNKFHIQGEDKSNFHMGAFYNNVLVAVMTFDNKRQMNIKNNLDFELKRFCVNYNFVINGIANKLIMFFIKKYKVQKIISFADRRWTLDSNDNLYTKIGFKLIKTLSPDYSYYNQKIHRLKRFHKFSFGKSSLKRKFPKIYNENKTEWQMMQELGYDRIWDCGKFKYELILTYSHE